MCLGNRFHLLKDYFYCVFKIFNLVYDSVERGPPHFEEMYGTARIQGSLLLLLRKRGTDEAKNRIYKKKLTSLTYNNYLFFYKFFFNPDFAGYDLWFG